MQSSPQPQRSEPFLITGLPRSRTAWWAVVTGAVHEPDGLRLPWVGGVSDSGKGLLLPEILALHGPRPRTLIVRRSREDVEESFRRYVGDRFALNWREFRRQCAELEQYFCWAEANILVKTVTFDECNDIEAVRACLAHLRVPEPANLEQMMHMVVNSSLDYNLKRLARAREAA